MPSSPAIVDELGPQQAYEAMRSDETAVMVDVRTSAEWAFVGVPDLRETGQPLLTIEWARLPGMIRNEEFVSELLQHIGSEKPGRVFFICRSGARSMSAAQQLAGVCEQRGIPVHCTNVAEGFEGDVDANGHRGQMNGWKAAGLPWRQS